MLHRRGALFLVAHVVAMMMVSSELLSDKQGSQVLTLALPTPNTLFSCSLSLSSLLPAHPNTKPGVTVFFRIPSPVSASIVVIYLMTPVSLGNVKIFAPSAYTSIAALNVLGRGRRISTATCTISMSAATSSVTTMGPSAFRTQSRR